MKDFEKNHRRLTFFGYVLILIATAIIMATLTAGGYYALRIAKNIEQHGLKTAIEQLWYGKDQ